MQKPGIGEIALAVLVVLFILPLITVSYIAVSRDEITPNDEFFVLSISGTPTIDINTWRLNVTGLVENELDLTYDNITSLKNASFAATLKCVEGPFGRAVWKGVYLHDVLNLSGLKNGSQEVIFHGADTYSSSLTLEDIYEGDILLAWEMNNETLPPDHGYPLRVIAPEKKGYKWVKWINRIEVVDTDFKGYWESRGWGDDAGLTASGDWFTHAFLLSLFFVPAGLATISGLKHAEGVRLWKKMPEWMNRKFHVWTSMLSVSGVLFIFAYWTITTYQERGDLFYTNHGIVAGAMVTLYIACGITGHPILYWKKKFFRELHAYLALVSLTIYAMVLFLGIVLAWGT